MAGQAGAEVVMRAAALRLRSPVLNRLRDLHSLSSVYSFFSDFSEEGIDDDDISDSDDIEPRKSSGNAALSPI